MKIINKLVLYLVFLVFALSLPMLQVWADEDADQEQQENDKVYSYYLLQEQFNNGEKVFEKTYSFSFSHECFVCAAPYNDTSYDYHVCYYDDVSESIIYATFDSVSCVTKNYFLGSDSEITEGIMNISLIYGELRPGYVYSASFDDMKIFSSYAAAEAYFKDGDDSGWVNKPDPEEYSYFSLSGFQYDDSISASWSGIYTDSQLIKNHIADVEVVVSPSFFLILEPGEKYEEFKEPENLLIPLSGSFKGTYDSFFEGNPYKGRALLSLDFYPRYFDSDTGNMYRGDSVTVRFDVDGKITNVDLPESSLTPVYDPGCYFVSPSSVSTVDSQGSYKTFFRWNKVATTYLYKTSYISIDIGYGGTWYFYSKDHFFSDNSMSLSVVKITNFLKEVVSDFKLFQGCKIRFTPFYNTSSGSYYGKPIIVSLSQIGQMESITELDGDYLDEINPPEFVDKTPTDWFENTTLWDNVEYIKDHSEDDIDLDNLTFNFFKMLKAVINACGQFPALVTTVFSFLPSDISKLLVISLSLIIVLRILGR